ncbi:hypothetical protein [Mangrovicoccus ximenensis]|uniref:hypothetical protein n=1 Tax=Mangrovicoccus ximenensis TaxID=1911570 RepID=UPI000D3A5A2F|nr:hypothetical protein [Mangrovicoccus ximenensis]
MAVLFTLPLCVASVSGGLWVSVRKRPLDRIRSLAALALTTAGGGLSALGGALGLTVLGAVLVGLCLAPLGTAGSLALEHLAPEGRKPEVFALQRTAHALGIIGASAILAVAPVSAALSAAACLMAAVTLWAVLGGPDRD